jgi:hypothetical protein
VPNGKDANGRFAKGNKLGKGNPLGKRVQELRVALVEAVSIEDLTAVVARLIREALAGDIQAIRCLLDRLLGPPQPLD